MKVLPNAKYVVKGEHTLGYLVEGAPNLMGVLAGCHDPKNGSVYINPHTDIRSATVKDFADYRVALPPDFLEAGGE